VSAVLSLPSPIARLNDAFRTTFTGGRIMLTAGVNALPDSTKANILAAVRQFGDFDPDNDPRGEHDFGAFTVDEHRCFWKIDHYNLTLDGGSENPDDPSVTTRVLTIMLANEY